MKKYTSYKSYLLVALLYGLGTCQLACSSCGNSKDSPATSKPTTNPAPTPSRPPATSAVDAAIRELEGQVVGNPNPDPRLEKIYAVIAGLPPLQFTQNLDGKKARTNDEKNGWELFEKVLDGIFPSVETVDWLIEKNLLNPNEENSAGELPFEKAFDRMMACKIDIQREDLFSPVLETLITRKATLTPEKSAALLERVIENHINNAAKMGQDNLLTKEKTTIEFLKNQGGTLTSAKASTLLQQLIEVQGNQLSQKSQDYLIDLLEAYKPAAIDPGKATALLQAATKQQEKGAKTYQALLSLGADPNKVQVTKYDNSQVPFLHYVMSLLDDDAKELFKQLVASPNTDINILDTNNQTPAMEMAYNRSGTDHVKALLQREDLDINTITSNHSGTQGCTLLDLVVDNCLQIPSGHDWQQENIIKNVQSWLPILQEMAKHAKFFVTPANIQRAEQQQKRIESLVSTQRIKEALELASQVIALLKNAKQA